MTTPEVKVRYEPDHDGTVAFDEHRTPFLQYGRHPEYGPVWTLYYLDDPDSETAGVESYFIAGDLADVDAVVKSAQRWLAGLRDD